MIRVFFGFLMCLVMSENGMAAGNQKIDQLGGQQLECLALAVYHEARGEPLEGQQLVAWVILERSRSEKQGWFGGPTVCGVVYHRLRGVPQFAWTTLPKERLIPRDVVRWQQARTVAQRMHDWWVTHRSEPTALSGILWFMGPEKVTNDCWFRRALVSMGRIGGHEFFREPRDRDERRATAARAPAKCRQIAAR